MSITAATLICTLNLTARVLDPVSMDDLGLVVS